MTINGCDTAFGLAGFGAKGEMMAGGFAGFGIIADGFILANEYSHMSMIYARAKIHRLPNKDIPYFGLANFAPI